jgi:uncharacterized membrane protein
LPNSIRLVKLTSHLPRLKFAWDSRVGPTLLVSFKKWKISLVFCHRRADRCIRIFGHTSFLCARCTGLCIGVIPVLFFALSNTSIPIVWALIFILPLIVDSFTQIMGIRESNNLMRLITGILFTPSFYSLTRVII